MSHSTVTVHSSYHRYYSTEIALTIFDIVMADDAGFISSLALLDLSTAFDTADHQIVPKRLQTSHHITGSDLN